MNKFVLKFILALIICSMLVAIPNIRVVRASGTIYIRADGSVEGTDKIQRQGNVYTFTGNVFGSIVVERDDIVIDGVGYALNGTGGGKGIYLSESDNVTIKNFEINDFYFGISLDNCSNNHVTGNIIEENNYGIVLSNCSNNIISENNIIANGHSIDLGNSSNTVVTGNIVDENVYGIQVSKGSNNVISENKVTANMLFGILLDLSSNNSVNENNLTHNNVGIELNSSPNNVLSDNSMDNNVVNFEVVPKLGSHLNSVNDVDTSNTVDGKPIYYWVNQKYRTVPSDAGCIVLVNCTNITVKNLNLTNNGEGVLLVFTTNSTITKNNITNNRLGIYLRWSSNNSIHGNSITDNNGFIIYLHDSSDNIFYNNTFINNELGVKDSSFWNFWVAPSVNIWDDDYPSGGNYWDDYTGVDKDGDGIGDTPYVIDENNQDNYPLMDSPISSTQQSEPFPITWIIVAIAIIYIIGGTAALLVYFIEVKK
jgi:parallel beta-helix repeat protein